LDCTPNLAAWENIYKRQHSYVPGTALNANLTKTIPVVINIWQDTLGNQNYPNDSTTIARLTESINQLNNSFWGNNDLPSDPIAGVPFIDDTQLRVSLEGIYFYQSALSTDSADGHCIGIATMNAAGVAAHPEFVKYFQIHIVPTMCDTSDNSYGGSGGVLTQSRVPELPNSFVLGGIYAHEIGHLLGLFHIYDFEREQCNRGHIDFLDDVFGDGDEDQPWCTEPLQECDICFPDVGWDLDPSDTANTSTNNMMGGTSSSGYFSPLQMGRMHRSLALDPIKKYAWGYSSEPYVISQFEEWDFNIKFYQDIVIPAGKHLIIRCIVEMVPEAKIIVQPGGKLTIDGGKVTAAQYSDTFWGGIEVWGNSDQAQYPPTAPYYQGLLILKNGAVIEHAREAIRVWKPGDWNSMGGVVRVEGTHGQLGATFKNCRRSLEYMAYQNFSHQNDSILLPNQGTFNYARFEVDNAYRGGGDFAFHATLWGVDGIKFTACTMVNSQSNITQSSKLGGGIGSLDANYSVTGKCNVITQPGVPCPTVSLDRGTFTGLGHAIEARDGGSGRGFTASDLNFNNNIVGVYTNGLSQFTVAKNKFVLGERDVVLDGTVEGYFLQEYHRAISIQQSHGFRIEENTIEPSGDVHALGMDGIIIANSGSNNTQVYKNTVGGVNNAYVGEGMCTDPLHSLYIGHQFLCNTDSLNEYNITARQGGGSDPETHAIRMHQGNKAIAAQNKFDQELGTPLESDFKNTTSWPVRYWHKVGATEPVDVTPGYVIVAEATNANTCPSHLIGGGIVVGDSGLTGLGVRFTTAKTAYINTSYVFNSLLDGGNTDVVVTEIQSSWPSDAWELRDYLVNQSPFLSTEVLKEMIKSHVLPQAMELEICLANPEATKLDEFIKWVEYDADYPFPAYMIDLIAGSWVEDNFRMQLESEMGAQHADMTFAADAMQAIYQSDTSGIPVDSMLSRWHQLPNYGARYSEVQVLLRKRDFNGARSVLDSVAVHYPMKEGRPLELEGALWFVDRMKDLDGGGRSVMQMDSTEVAQFETFALDRHDIPGTWVKNILCFGYQICLPDPGGGEAIPKALHPTIDPEAKC